MTFATSADFEYVEQVVLASKSSFTMGMKILPAQDRGYLFAIYAYCRLLDDIADEEGSVEEKNNALDHWQAKIEAMINNQPDCAITRILADGLVKYDLPLIEFYNLIDGMRADANGPIKRPSQEELITYCRNVAVSVGLLSLPIFGRTDQGAKDFANELGMALQYTNILRDVYEDDQIGRLYLPEELLAKYGVLDIQSPDLKYVLGDLAKFTQNHYDNAEKLLYQIGKENLRPAIMMKEAYFKIFQNMQKRGWHVIQPRMRLSKMEKAFLAMKLMASS